MLTTCSKCKTRFRVTAAQLKAAGGKVRCSRCQTVFDAFGSLQDETVPEPVLPAPVSADVPGGTDAAIGRMPIAVDEAMDMSLSAAASAAPDLDVALEAGTPMFGEAPDLALSPEQTKPVIEDLFADLSHEGPLDYPGGGAAASAVGAEAETPERTPAVPRPSPNLKAPDFDIPPVPEAHPSAAEIILAPLESARHRAPAPRRPWETLLWLVGSVFMVLWLAVQLVNAGRAGLAQNPVIGPSLQALYAAVGRPLPPPHDPTSWSVDGINVTSDPQAPGGLSITGSLENQGGQVQPWPLLRVVLTDRYGDTLRARDFKSADYLPANQANVLLAAGQATRFRIDVVDPGADAVGFAVSPCLDVAAARVCATTEHE